MKAQGRRLFRSESSSQAYINLQKRTVHIVYPVVLFQSSQDGKSYELASLIYIQLRTARMIRRITQTLVFTVAKDACGVSLGPDLPRASSSSLPVGNEAVSGHRPYNRM